MDSATLCRVCGCKKSKNVMDKTTRRVLKWLKSSMCFDEEGLVICSSCQSSVDKQKADFWRRRPARGYLSVCLWSDDNSPVLLNGRPIYPDQSCGPARGSNGRFLSPALLPAIQDNMVSEIQHYQQLSGPRKKYFICIHRIK